MKRRYEDFVFDIDGTLLDTERTGVLSLMQTIRELTGVEMSYEEAYRFFGVPSSKAASTLGYADEADKWAIVGLLHDLDFEQFPDQHCIKEEEIMRSAGVEEDIIHATCSHGYGITVDIQPEHEMEKVLFAADELTGLIGACALVRPSKSVSDMEVKSVKKKYKTPAFAAGCSREIIQRGADMLGWDLTKLIELTLQAMKDTEAELNEKIAAL